MSKNFSVVPKKNVPLKYKSEFCDEKMTFEECELAILRQAVDETEKETQQF